MKTAAAVILLTFALFYAPSTHAATFGSGANQFDIAFVTIGNPDNHDDTTGVPNPAGKVEYAYRMGKYEISRGMITKANVAGGLGITMDPMWYVTGGPRDDMPATGVTWIEAAQFVNWLNTSTGHIPAYKFNGTTFELWQSGDAGYNPANPFRSSQAFYVLPSVHEWYKAAYYDALTGVYYDYPTGSDTAPAAVASGTVTDTAVYRQSESQGPADITLAGGLSPYGTMGQGGNVLEWAETELDLVNDSGSSDRWVRGGHWNNNSFAMLATIRFSGDPSGEADIIGFRVASIPEASTSLMCAMAAGGLLVWTRRPN